MFPTRGGSFSPACQAASQWLSLCISGDPARRKRRGGGSRDLLKDSRAASRAVLRLASFQIPVPNATFQVCGVDSRLRGNDCTHESRHLANDATTEGTGACPVLDL